MSRRFSQVPLNIWRNPHFKGLSDDARLALLFFWAGPHSTSAGVSVVPDAYASADLGWTLDRWMVARDAVETAGLVKRDASTETVLIVGFLRCNRPSNARHRAAILSQINNIDCDELRELAEAEFAAVDAKAETQPGPATSDMTPQMKKMTSNWTRAA